jgi:hypothetical protein
MSIYIILGILIALSIVLGLPSVKGKIGEGSVIILLNRLDKEHYLVLNDVYIPKGEGKTAQIDHVVVSPYGIFVIETKNYKGWITGGETSQYWTQTIYKKKEKLFNPIKQNNGHIKALKALLKDFPNLTYISIVTFSSRADLKVKVTSNVVYTPQILKTIKKYNKEIISLVDVRKVYEQIANANIQDKDTKNAHVVNIKQDVKEKNLKINNDECPWCGSELVERKGQHGSFKGCSNYPKCRFTVKG